MQDTEFTRIENFETILELAQEQVTASSNPYKLNFSLKVVFDVDLVKKPQLLDAVERAKDFQNIKKPESLYLNHGEYISAAGIPHVINELKNKHTGNRALISLINQKDIIGSGDSPIPSFMVLQFSLESDQLYGTAYFRALEVSKFLRINIEEIRIVCSEIYQSIRTIKGIRLNIFAFRAYITKDFNPLERPRLELLDPIQVFILMQKNTAELCTLLREKLKASSVIENDSLKLMSEIVGDSSKSQDLKPCFRVGHTKRKLKQCVDLSTKLIEMRKGTSHASDIDEVNKDYLKALNELIEEIEKCE
jgi:hypothetical protein